MLNFYNRHEKRIIFAHKLMRDNFLLMIICTVQSCHQSSRADITNIHFHFQVHLQVIKIYFSFLEVYLIFSIILKVVFFSSQ